MSRARLARVWVRIDISHSTSESVDKTSYFFVGVGRNSSIVVVSVAGSPHDRGSNVRQAWE